MVRPSGTDGTKHRKTTPKPRRRGAAAREREILAALSRLYDISIRPNGHSRLSEIAGEFLETVIRLTGADMGNIQLPDADGSLKIVASRGFGPDFLKFFASVHSEKGASCYAASLINRRTIVEDVAQSPIFIGTPSMDVMLAAGALACQSTPLVSRSGQLVGMLNTHYRKPIREESLDLPLIDILAGQAADIIAQVQAQQALRESEEQHRESLESLVEERTAQLARSERHYRTLVENLPITISRMDRDYRYRYLNPASDKDYGTNREQFIGKSWDELGLDEAKVRAWRECFEQAAETGTAVKFAFELPDAQTGSQRCYEAQVVPETDELGRVESFLTISENVTERKKLEAELLRLDRLNLVGEMAAAIGHEVRNPLTTVRGYLQMLQRKQAFAGHREQFDTMIGELDRANGIISDFLSLARNKAVEMKKYNLNDVVSAMVPLLQAEALRTGHGLKVDTAEIPAFAMDEKEIRQLLLNLCNNAFHAMEPGGTLTIATGAEKGRVVLTVRDTGRGIPPEVLAKLGTPFVTTKETGTGLGLPVCYRIAERHGGNIDVKTSPTGTTFRIKFKHKH